MDTSNQHNTRNIILGILLLVVVLAGATMWQKWSRARSEARIAATPMNVELTRTEEVAGFLSTPPAFPSDIPFEEGKLVESVTTNFPSQNAVQTSVTYRTENSVEEKYSEYLAYMNTAGYAVKEGNAESQVLALYGSKDGAKLTITISTWENLTVVQIAHLAFTK